MSLRAAIFDFGGVFTTSPVENFAAFERAHALPQGFIGGVIKARLHDGAFARYERGEISFAEFSDGMAAETEAAGFRIDGAAFVALLDVDPKPEMVEALLRLKSGRFLAGCITNNFPAAGGRLKSPLAHPQLAAALGAFDCIIESSKVGVRKPEPRIYEMMCEALGVEPQECVFIDDLGVNLKPARAMGMQTIKAPLGDVRPAIAELSRLTGVPL